MIREFSEPPAAANVFDPLELDYLWFQDGNIVLSAVDAATARPVLFRVHMSSLASRSRVFNSMLSLPQGEDDEQTEVHEGSPLVRLPDSAEDVEALLRAIYDPYALFRRSPRSDTPLRVQKALHMASKYMMDDLCKRLISVVEQEWPLRLKDMELRDGILDDIIAKYGAYSSTEWPEQLIPEPASAIALAERYNIPSILPAAYYNLLRCNPNESWELTLRKVCSAGDTRFLVTGRGGKPARWECLSAASFLKLLQVQNFVESAQHKYFSFSLPQKIPGCLSLSQSRSCFHTWMRILDNSHRIPVHIHARDIFGQLRDLEVRMLNANMCYNCYPKYTDEIQRVKVRVWEGLEEICCL
ncbi:hypothetical protein SCHPADRAFT_827761 [Schizopora paradoxa]|uniref:BTB domain-containing protein n=1 Tax=Schizopora paradoxa TaxID=27342 RepID=A0A0H2RNN5_9AGAM|nr:hypothetical protein SCHPADRAFT_827761 [Schizopora paradoxa]